MKRTALRRALLLLLAVACLLSASSCANRSGAELPVNKKELMDRFLEGKLGSYAPSAFFVHYRSDQKEGEAAVQAHLEYYLKSNMDILKVQFEQSIPKIGVLEVRNDWIPEDFYRPTLGIIRRLQEIAGADVYVLPTIYCAYQIAYDSLGPERIREAAQNQPEALKSVLDSYRRALVWLIRECKAAGIQGFYMCTQGGEEPNGSIPGFFENYVRAYDLAVMGECCAGTKLNILHICDWQGPYEDLARYSDYPGQIVNTPIEVGGEPFSLSDAYQLFGRPVLGGFNRKGEINQITPEQASAKAAEILAEAPAGKVMLGADCTVGSAPFANIHAAIAAAHGAR